MYTVFDIVMIPLQLLIIFFTLYYFFVSWFGLFGKKKEVKIYDESKTFALIACAHNEERVIAQLVDNLRRLNYNDALYDIFVVADNCDDHTAAVARKAGAIVYERFSEEGKGKGFALAWMFERLFKLEKKYDAVCVFDADNLVHLNFLQEMNSRLCNGERIIQGYIDAKNPTDTWVSGVFAISFWIVNHVWSLAKYNMGLSCCLGGTGMCFDTEVLKRYGWRATCLTEDMEFTIQAMMENIPTTWAHDAIIYDEKPLTFMQTWHQRKRWSQGHFDVADRYLWPMIKKAIRTRNMPPCRSCWRRRSPCAMRCWLIRSGVLRRCWAAAAWKIQPSFAAVHPCASSSRPHGSRWTSSSSIRRRWPSVPTRNASRMLQTPLCSSSGRIRRPCASSTT